MSEHLRRCGSCEYYNGGATCHFNPPTHNSDISYKTFPRTNIDDFCSKWEPKWSGNETINKAWKEFQMLIKLANNEEN